MNEQARLQDYQGTDTASDFAHVEAVVRRSGSSFYWGMRRMALDRRRGMYAIYAFCREVDDIADGEAAEADKRGQLQAWRDELERLYANAPTRPITRALRRAIVAFDLRQEDFIAVIDGMEMDAPQRVRIADVDELLLYCDRVACAVGRLCVRVFGLGPTDGDALAKSLGLALQLTNILRDIAEDAERDRLYLPSVLLTTAGIDVSGSLGSIVDHPALPAVCAHIGTMAEAQFAAAECIIQDSDRAKVRPAVMMKEVYQRVLVKLQQSGWRDPHARVGLSKLEKLWIAFRYGFFG